MAVEESSSYLTVAAAPDASRSPEHSISSSLVAQTLLLLQSDDDHFKVIAAKDIRRLTKTSQRYRRRFSAAVRPLVGLLVGASADANEAALAALLNLAVKDETNKINIIEAGALKSIIGFLQSNNHVIQEHAAAALVTLSASSVNKPIISSCGAIPRLVEILRYGSLQTKFDALMALYNLSTHPDSLTLILQTDPIPPLVDTLKSCKKSSKTLEKCSALIESLMGFEEARWKLTSVDGGILAVVEVLEGGSLQSREHAVGILLTMCQSNRSKYREPILREGVIPGLLELTVQGTMKSQPKAQRLLQLLRDTPYPRSEFQPDTLGNIVRDLTIRMDGDDQIRKAKQMLAEMVQVSMEQSLKHMQKRAMVCIPADK